MSKVKEWHDEFCKGSCELCIILYTQSIPYLDRYKERQEQKYLDTLERKRKQEEQEKIFSGEMKI